MNQPQKTSTRAMKTVSCNSKVKNPKPIGCFITICLLIATVSIANAATPVARWEFENDYNDSIASYDLTQRGSVQFVTNQSRRAVQFDGGIVTAPAAPPLDALDLPAAEAPNPTVFNSGLSLTGWIRHHQSAQGTGPGSSSPLVAQSGWSLGNQGWTLGVSYDGKLDLALRDALDRRNNSVSIPSVPENVWTHFAVTWDGSPADGVVYYINAVVVGHTATQSGTFGGFPNLPIQMVLGATPSDAPEGALEHGLVGALDCISVWTGVLTDSEIQADYLAKLAPHLGIRCSQVELCWDTAPNLVYQLQYQTNLSNAWLPLGGLVSGDGSRFCTNDTVVEGQAQRFYQLSVTNAP